MPSALDRFAEAHFHIHLMEDYYHFADPFRYALNSFMRALKEVPAILQLELQGSAGFKDWFRERLAALRSDPLIEHLAKSRDVVVHRGALIPQSWATVGITEGRGIKFGLNSPLDPLEDSDKAMLYYLQAVHRVRDVIGVFVWLGGTDLDLSLSCRHSGDRIRVRIYTPERVRKLFEQLAELTPNPSLQRTTPGVRPGAAAELHFR